MSPKAILIEFYRAYIEWVDAGCPNVNNCGFTKIDGLCWLLKYYIWEVLPNESTFEVSGFQRGEFAKAGLDTCFPFDSEDTYFYKEQRDGTLHENPQRVAWARNYK